MNYLAAIDTNVIVSAFISKNKYSPPSMIVKEKLGGRITPIINDFILEEYRDVLLRPKFHLAKDDVDSFIMRIKHYGYNVEPTPTEEDYPDSDDAVFYETALTIKNDVFLVVTGNIKHYPNKEFVITPAEMAVRLDES